MSTLARLVAQVRAQATDRLYQRLSGLVSAEQTLLLDDLLDVPADAEAGHCFTSEHP